MAFSTLYPLALVLHLSGLVLMAGTTLIDYIIYRRIWRTDRAGGLLLLNAVSRLPALIGLGLLLLIVSGVTMMGITHGAFGEQLWFRVKFGIVLLIVINGVVVGRRNATKLRGILAGPEDADPVRVSSLRSKLRLFYVCQLGFFLLIIILSVYKFN